jgi:iron complex transport system substrate-binding protein
LIDDMGMEVSFDRTPTRVISLIPSVTDIVRALDAEEVLIARTNFDTASSLQELPSVGDGLHPNLENVISLNPDLVIRFAAESDQVTPQRLSEFGIPQLALRPEGIADVQRSIINLGRLLGHEPEADRLIAVMRATLDSIRTAVGGLEPVRVAYILGGSPPWVAGPGSFIDELIQLAGGENVFSDLATPYAGVSPEEVIDRPAEVRILAHGGSLEGVLEELETAPGSPLLNQPSHRLHEAALALARLLHPTAFP